jgi:uncharacterized membrane protein
MNARLSFKSKLRLFQTVQILFLMGVLFSRDTTVQLMFLVGGVLFMAMVYYFSEDYRIEFNSKLVQKLVALVIVFIALVYLYLTRDHPVL